MYFNKKWEKEEKSIHKAMSFGAAGIYADLQGFTRDALPRISYLELPEVKKTEKEPIEKIEVKN